MVTRLKLPQHVIFVPGFMCDERLFGPQIETLSKTNVPCNIEPMKNGSTIREFALNILNSAPATFALVGLSMGGIVALEVIRMAPNRVSHLALLNTTPFEDKSLNQRKDHLKRVRQGKLKEILRDELKPKYLSPSTSKKQLLPLITDMGENLGVDTFVKQSIALMIRKAAVDRLSEIKCPTAVITGEDDTICSADIHRVMHDHIQGSQLLIIPECGHLSTLEAPEAVNEILFHHWGFQGENILQFPKQDNDTLEKI